MRIKISLKTQNMAGLFEVNSKKSECLIKPNWSLITLNNSMSYFVYKYSIRDGKIEESCKERLREKVKNSH